SICFYCTFFAEKLLLRSINLIVPLQFYWMWRNIAAVHQGGKIVLPSGTPVKKTFIVGRRCKLSRCSGEASFAGADR
ncbi:MAG: hypothetical protein WAX00_06660, partial [Trichococcus flocculiformis]